MPVSRIWLRKQNFTGSNGSGIAGTFTAPQMGTLADMQIWSNGFDAVDEEGAYHGNTFKNTSTSYTDKRGTTVPKDQYTQIVIGSGFTTGTPGVLVRADDGAGDAYVGSVYISATTRVVGEFTSSSYTQLATATGDTVSGGETLEMEAQGTTLRVGIEGEWDITGSDSTHASGDPGIEGYLATNTAVGDTFEAGALSANIAGIKIITNARNVRQRRKMTAERLSRIMRRNHTF